MRGNKGEYKSKMRLEREVEVRPQRFPAVLKICFDPKSFGKCFKILSDMIRLVFQTICLALMRIGWRKMIRSQIFHGKILPYH